MLARQVAEKRGDLVAAGRLRQVEAILIALAWSARTRFAKNLSRRQNVDGFARRVHRSQSLEFADGSESPTLALCRMTDHLSPGPHSSLKLTRPSINLSRCIALADLRLRCCMAFRARRSMSIV